MLLHRLAADGQLAREVGRGRLTALAERRVAASAAYRRRAPRRPRRPRPPSAQRARERSARRRDRAAPPDQPNSTARSRPSRIASGRDSVTRMCVPASVSSSSSSTRRRLLVRRAPPEGQSARLVDLLHEAGPLAGADLAGLAQLDGGVLPEPVRLGQRAPTPPRRPPEPSARVRPTRPYALLVQPNGCYCAMQPIGCILARTGARGPGEETTCRSDAPTARSFRWWSSRPRAASAPSTSTRGCSTSASSSSAARSTTRSRTSWSRSSCTSSPRTPTRTSRCT